MTTTTGNRDSAGRASGPGRTRDAGGTTGCCKPGGRIASDRQAHAGNQAAAAGNGGPGVLNGTSRRTAPAGSDVSGISFLPRASWQPAGWMSLPASGPPVRFARHERPVVTVERESRGRDAGTPAHATIDPGPGRTAAPVTARCLCPFGSAGVVTPNVQKPQVVTGPGCVSARPAGRRTMTWPDRATAFDVTDGRREAAASIPPDRHCRRARAWPAHTGPISPGDGASASRTGPARRPGTNRADGGSSAETSSPGAGWTGCPGGRAGRDSGRRRAGVHPRAGTARRQGRKPVSCPSDATTAGAVRPTPERLAWRGHAGRRLPREQRPAPTGADAESRGRPSGRAPVTCGSTGPA